MHLAKSPLKPIAALCLALLLSACSHTAQNLKMPTTGAAIPGAELNKVVARVNGKDISAAELKRAEKILIASKPGLRIPPTMQKDFETQALNQLISAELLFQASQKFEIKDLDQQTEAKVAQIKKGFPNAREYDKGLQSIGLDDQTFQASVRRDLAVAYLVNTAIANQITVGEDEVKRFYDQNPQNFLTPEQVRASHILIGVDSKGGAEAKKEARARAEKLRAELAQGSDFATLARENSSCPSSQQGGDLGFFGKGRMDPQFEQAAFALETGGLSQVVETRFGYHIVKLVERKKAEVASLSGARLKIEGFLRTQKANAAVEAFVGEARRSAKVELLL
jgi:peptidyl-prolyl cis-trans isomerase C